MNNFYFIGVDVSKKKLDFCVMFENKVVHEEVVANHPSAVTALIHQLDKELGISNAQMLVCAEHTGQYTYPLVCACESVECKLWLEHPSNIKYSSGVQRGKNDKIDARRIAIYAARFEDKVRYYERPEQEIERLKQLEAERCLYVVDLAKYKAQLKDQKEYMAERTYNDKARRLKKLMKGLEEAIKSITDEMESIVSSTEVLDRQHKLLQSIDGVGPVVALNMIIVTEGFTRFDNARQFNCFAGLAPFQYTSGSSQHSRARVSHRADKCIKTLLQFPARLADDRNGREVKEGLYTFVCSVRDPRP
ncbi:MAG: IS110 family transposase [Bacteroidaceae bacterium]|nr:IS110 family transposase [Bacteroidaceae bacterium]